MTIPVIFGISGYELTDQEIELFSQNKVHGFILFSRNIQNGMQLKALTKSLLDLYPDEHHERVKIFIDQEGGRVARLKPPITSKLYPPAKFFADLYESGKIEESKILLYKNYYELTLDIKKYNIDSPCSPVCDMYYDYANEVIGDRSFGSKVEQIVELASVVIDSIKSAGGIPIIKHIPGHGRSVLDSHLALPRIDAKLEDLNKTDFEVFRRIAGLAEYTMTAHIIFDALDSKLPVTLSKEAIKFIRNDIGFKGLIMTDDLCMKALYENLDITPENVGKIALESLEAGCDILLHCNGDIKEIKEILKIF
jgi:beta-glucosidase-like glycosyl hydrolase